MLVTVHERAGARIVECTEAIARPADALALVAACIENASLRLLIESRWLPPQFFELRTQFAGEFLQKLENYHIRLAAIIPPAPAHGERFREFLLEARKGRSLRVFEERREAEDWLASA